jgi:hypothetical protein
MMDLHIRGGLLSGCLTSVGCLHDILSLENWRSSDNLVTFFMLATWRLVACLENPTLEEEHLAFWRRVLSPRQHGVAWMLAWRHGVDLGTHRLQQCSCKGSGPNGAHGLGGVLESLEAWRRSIGHISWSALALEPCLCTTSPWSLTCVPLECSTSHV